MCTDLGAPNLPPVLRPVAAEQPFAGQVIPIEPVDSVRITTVCDNAIDILMLDEGPAHRVLGRSGEPPTVPAPTLADGKVTDALQAEHGFSAHVEINAGGQVHRLLFDTGTSPNGCVENLARLDLKLTALEGIVLSHGHFDHATGLSGLATALGRTGMPVVLHPDFWTKRRVAIPGREPMELPTTSRRALDEAGFDVIEDRRPSILFAGSALVTGEVDRTTGFETGFAIHQADRGNGWEPDPLILDDQAMVLHVAGKGLVILTGCGHSGIVNICRYATRLTGVSQVYAVIGGFHLNGPLFEPIIGPTCDGLAELNPAVLVPSHCTGWKATHALAARFPDSFIQPSVGTTYHLDAEPAASAAAPSASA